ncbi:MAG: ATP-binding protein [Candidatus Tectomicrobia bacterium]|nr:ATP-binding protein [Candidatus Tectomicrobia bacterium]
MPSSPVGDHPPLPSPLVLLRLPSDFRFERVAVDTVTSLARQLRFPHEKVEILRTAVGEAYLNAIEHGNRRDAASEVEISFVVEDGQLTVLVRDGGHGFDLQRLPSPCLEEKLAGHSPARGWGLFLMRALVDDLRVDHSATGGNRLIIVVRRQAGEGAMGGAPPARPGLP